MPDSLRELVVGRVADLSPRARRTLLVTAALRHPTAELVERASSAAGLAAAEDAGLLRMDGDRVAFTHPLYASAVYTAAASGRRRAMHGQLAELVADAEERVRHRALAAGRPDEEVAAALEDAAAQARARGAWESASELLEQARALTPADHPEAARRRGVLAAEHNVHAGDRPRARALLEDVLSTTPRGPTRGDALGLLAEICSNDGSFADAARLLEEALEYAEDPALAVRIELNLTYVHFNDLGDSGAADLHAGRALERAAAFGDDAALGAALGVRAIVDFLLGRGVDWSRVERAVALEDPGALLPLALRPSMIAALLKLYVGRVPEARAELMALRLASIDSGDESDLALVLFWLAWAETLSGAFATAASLAQEAADHAAHTGSDSSLGWALAQRAIVHAHRGEAAEARADAQAATEICTRLGLRPPLLWVAAALGLLELSLGNAAGAWAATAPLAEAHEAHGIAEPSTVFLPATLEALIGLGELDRAERLLESFAGRARELDRIWALATSARCRGLLYAARGDLPRAEEALEHALAEHGRVEMPFELARTLLVLGQVRRRRRRKRAARDALDQALALFEQMGAPLWAQRAREEIARLGARRGPGELTPTEARVVELAAEGQSNKEIARDAVRRRAHGRGAPVARLREARDPLAQAARGAPRRRGAAARSLRVSVISPAARRPYRRRRGQGGAKRGSDVRQRGLGDRPVRRARRQRVRGDAAEEQRRHRAAQAPRGDAVEDPGGRGRVFAGEGPVAADHGLHGRTAPGWTQGRRGPDGRDGRDGRAGAARPGRRHERRGAHRQPRERLPDVHTAVPVDCHPGERAVGGGATYAGVFTGTEQIVDTAPTMGVGVGFPQEGDVPTGWFTAIRYSSNNMAERRTVVGYAVCVSP